MVLVDGQYVTGLGVDQAYVLLQCAHDFFFRKILNHCFKIWGENQIKLRFCENATKCLRNHHLRFVPCSASQIYGGDFTKFCGLHRIYEL